MIIIGMQNTINPTIDNVHAITRLKKFLYIVNIT